MQTSVPELIDLAAESPAVLELYGPDVSKPGTFAANCLLARRLVERGVRFIQLYHRGWDNHGSLPSNIPLQCRDIDQPQAALITDLKQRGLLDDTLIIWGGEFGRTVYGQGGLQDDYGRDHHGRCFSMLAWPVAASSRASSTARRTISATTSSISRFTSTISTPRSCTAWGIDHTRLTFRFQGRDFRLTDVEGKLVTPILA